MNTMKHHLQSQIQCMDPHFLFVPDSMDFT
ncbi:unnamed protein product [Callosobruchus maculatus]|uniref:Uncharacterized protein n=1 Tax=Callosobruchus maculatus TaxID=64391 RepID=A0A653BMP7_CALMS|nr:unnamed protein product [Callosobruchus maculatus]